MRKSAVIIPIVLALLYLLWLLFLVSNQVGNYVELDMRLQIEQWLYIGIGFFITLIIVMLTLIPSKKTVTMPAPETMATPPVVPAGVVIEPVPAQVARQSATLVMPTEHIPAAPLTQTDLLPAQTASPQPGYDAATATQMSLEPEAIIVAEHTEVDETGKEEKIIIYPPEIEGGIYCDAFIPIGSNIVLNVKTMVGVACMYCNDMDKCWEKYKSQMTHDQFLLTIECMGNKYGTNAQT